MREASPSFILKSAAFLFVTLLLGPFYLLLLLFLYPWRLRLGPELVLIYSRICLRIFGVKIGRVGHLRSFRAIKGRVLIAANHVSFLDIFLVSGPENPRPVRPRIRKKTEEWIQSDRKSVV